MPSPTQLPARIARQNQIPQFVERVAECARNGNAPGVLDALTDPTGDEGWAPHLASPQAFVSLVRIGHTWILRGALQERARDVDYWLSFVGVNESLRPFKGMLGSELTLPLPESLMTEILESAGANHWVLESHLRQCLGAQDIADALHGHVTADSMSALRALCQALREIEGSLGKGILAAASGFRDDRFFRDLHELDSLLERVTQWAHDAHDLVEALKAEGFHVARISPAEHGGGFEVTACPISELPASVTVPVRDGDKIFDHCLPTRNGRIYSLSNVGEWTREDEGEAPPCLEVQAVMEMPNAMSMVSRVGRLAVVAAAWLDCACACSRLVGHSLPALDPQPTSPEDDGNDGSSMRADRP